MHEFSYLLHGKKQRIQANSIEEVRMMIPNAQDIVKGSPVSNAQCVDKQPPGVKVDPGRSSMV